ncbi:glycosyltransferase family 2 protein [Mucilaginibacter lappiensis]|uniref:glycosyltransferase family 2 protein n=1 Tax=Mucilaginibacter lappiensis TaxID=354630 RepID=UPI003D1AB1D7
MEKGYPLVSICMPAYNAGKYITEALNSIINQSYQNWEVIVINDGSTDNTALELEKISDIRVKKHHQENKGQCAAANKAFRLSQGDLIKFMDADDIISPDFIKEQVSKINGEKKIIAHASWGRFYKDDLATFTIAEDVILRDMKPADWLIASMTDKQVMLQCALWLIPREILDRSGLWNEKLSLINDFEFIIRVLLCADELKLAERATLYYRSGLASSLSATASKTGAESAYNAIDLGTQYLLRYENSNLVKKIAADCFQRLVYTFYPTHRSIINKAKSKVKELGGSGIPFPAGGYTKLLVRIIGWKATQQLKYSFKHIT